MRTTPREVCNKLKSRFKLNSIQKDILVGTLLGDGNIRLKGKFARLHIKHSSKQLSLVEYKRKIFKNISTMEVRVFKQKVGEKDDSFAEFVTLTHSEFLKFHQIFYRGAASSAYPNHKKIIPKNIQMLLKNPRSLAMWLMDDGSAEYAGVSLQTHSFSQKEVDLLRNAIESNFEIKTGRRLNKGKWIIYFPKACLSRLKNLVGKLMLPELRYKLVPYSTRLRTP